MVSVKSLMAELIDAEKIKTAKDPSDPITDVTSEVERRYFEAHPNSIRTVDDIFNQCWKVLSKLPHDN